MKAAMELFENICVKVVLGISLFIGLLFTFWAGFYTNEYPKNHIEKIDKIPDSILLNIILACVVVGILFLLQKLILNNNLEKNRKILNGIMLVECILALFSLVLWVLLSGGIPQSDQKYVYEVAVSFINNNFSSMLHGEYMNICPHQYGIVFLYETLFTITGIKSYKLIQLINIVCILLILYYGRKLVRNISSNQTVELYYLLLMPTFIPLYLYSIYIYGDIFQITAGVLGCALIREWCKNGKKRDAIGAILFVSLAFVAKKNTLVLLIALAIVLIIHALRNRRWQSALIAMAIFVLPLLCIRLIETSYEKRSGIEVEEGIPTIMWIAMGLQDTDYGPGFYNNYVIEAYMVDANKDSTLCKEIGKEYITERVMEFSKDWRYTSDFFGNKLMSQWNDHTFSSFVLTANFNKEPTGPVKSMYYGNTYNGMLLFMNRYLFVLYLGMLAGTIYLIKHKTNLYKCLPFIVIIGGFLYSILWEAKGRYVLPYVVLIIPYSALGLYALQCLFQKILASLKKLCLKQS